ncbi:MAG TPA: hypothetical protein DIT67_06635 [Octadecabacter sp.]|nr:hypothetical protein [Octadecabacter sp.]
MHLDVHDLREFYYRSPLGRAAQKVVRDELVRLWPEAKGQTVAGFGFAVPLLRPFLGDARRVIALMPGPQGVMPWPADGPNVSVLCEDTLWPLASGSVDKLVLMHGLETSDHPMTLLDECWRVLGPGGRALFIVPNRAGFWARSDITPFGYGRPYSLGQLETQLPKHQFLPERQLGALYLMPSTRRTFRRAGPLFEKVGRHMPTIMAGGAFMIEVTKLVYPPKGKVARTPASRSIRVLEGVGAVTPSAV